MDEPMEETCEADSTQVDSESVEQRQPMSSPLLRAGSMVRMTFTVEDYEKLYWPKLQQAINQLLTMAPGQYLPISYEQMYSCVYKCVCKQFSERLYQDLIRYMSNHLSEEAQQLEALTDNAEMFVEKFSYVLNQYLNALRGIVPIFNYMNRFYVETKLKTDLNEELEKLFRVNVVDKYIYRLLLFLDAAYAKPFTVTPAVMSGLVKNLYSLDKEYAKLNEGLFSKYIPNIFPPTTVTELDKYVEETKQLQRDISNLPDFHCCDSSTSRKRTNEDLLS